MLFLPSLCFAASGVLTAQGNVQGLPIYKGEKWEVWCSSSKDQVELQNWSTSVVIQCKQRGTMSVNGALNYDVYINGNKKCSVWIYVKYNGDQIVNVDIKTHYGTTYFK